MYSTKEHNYLLIKLRTLISLEWWYFTGHLTDSVKGKTLGLEYVIFHFNPTALKGGWMVNLAISDSDEEKLYYDHRFFQKKKFDFTNLPLDISLKKRGLKVDLDGQNGEYELEAEFGNYPIELQLKTEATKPVVLHDGIGYENYGD